MSTQVFNPLYLTLAMLGVCFVFSIYIARRFQREVAEDSTPATPTELYGPLEQAYYAGLMREEEYLRIREKMSRETRPSKAQSGQKKTASDDWATIDPSAG